MGTVYFVNGFIEAGKTTFIRELICRESFQIKGKTLLVLCEEGEVEYDENELKETNTVLEIIDEEEDFNEDHLAALEKKHMPERVIVEFNGMWDRKNLNFPWYWEDIMEIAVFDATTFNLYADNMRSLLAEQVRNAELVIFFKADEARDKLALYSRNIKAINAFAGFAYRGSEGDIILDPDENLPYDIESDELFLDDIGFAVMSMDAHERTGKYEGKKVHFSACVYKTKDDGEIQFVAGRQILTCCEVDMSFAGILCGYHKAYELDNKEWVKVTGIIRVIYDDKLGRVIPVCRVTDIEKITAPNDQIIKLI